MPEQIITTVNRQERKLEVDLETSALEVIREDLNLTGTKLVCGSGACGACTILVDGKPKCACLLPAVQLDGAEVSTIEAHAAPDGELHPVQKAFLDCDGLQCGFCTPGFINESIAFYDQWRSEKGKTRPEKEAVAEALAGHLCRCSAYVGIYQAVQNACEGKYDAPGMPENYRVDGIPKVKGEAKYTVDIQLPGQLTGLFLRSELPNSQITKLDLGKVKSMPGVKAVIRIKEDELCRFEGEPIVAVAAETRAQARAAIEAIECDFEPLPFVMTMDEARRENAPLVWDKNKNEAPTAGEGPKVPGNWDGNVRKLSISISSQKKGKAQKEVEQADKLSRGFYQGIFRTPVQFHACLEPHCAVAHWKSEEELTVYTSTQGVYWSAHELAKHYKLKQENVEVIAKFVGGGFGSKQIPGPEVFAAIDLAKAAGAPVAMINNRAEEFQSAGYRPPAEMEISLSANPDGTEPAYVMNAFGNAGIGVGSATADISGVCYTGINKKLQDFDVVTNFSSGCAMRGPGGPAAFFALEQGLDQLAEELDLSPLEFRRKWEKHEGLVALFDWVEKQELWKKRKKAGQQTGRFRKGIGLAFGGWLHIYMSTAEVEVEIGTNGITVRNAVQDMGQGSASVLVQAVSDSLKIPPPLIKVEIGSSRLNIGPTSGGSRTATTLYPTAKEAAEKAADLLIKQLEKNQNWKDINLKPDGIQHSEGKISWAELENHGGGVKAVAKRGKNEGFYALGMVPLGQGMNLGKDYGYGAYLIETEVDTLLGKIRVVQVQGAMRVGKIFVKSGAYSQCCGGVIQGIGHTLYEYRSLCSKTGRLLTRGLEDYRLPGIGDVPEISIDFLEEGFDAVKGKGIGLAELCTVPVAGAIANAVYNATGWRPMKAPILPENVLKGLSK